MPTRGELKREAEAVRCSNVRRVLGQRLYFVPEFSQITGIFLDRP